LFGKTNNESFIVREIFLTKNIENSPINFTISSDELIKAYDEAEKRNLDVVGIFHSHPGSNASPSLTDEKYMEVNPVPWIIFSTKNNEFRAYLFDSKIMQIPINIQQIYL